MGPEGDEEGNRQETGQGRLGTDQTGPKVARCLDGPVPGYRSGYPAQALVPSCELRVARQRERETLQYTNKRILHRKRPPTLPTLLPCHATHAAAVKCQVPSQNHQARRGTCPFRLQMFLSHAGDVLDGLG